MMFYFAYGSNMSLRRLNARIKSAEFVAVAKLDNHALKFQKKGADGSAKCDAATIANGFMFGVVYAISRADKVKLDRFEGLGTGYAEKRVVVHAAQQSYPVYLYVATDIDRNLKPFHWYKQHVLMGARENALPGSYIQKIEWVDSVNDPEPQRHIRELSIYSPD